MYPKPTPTASPPSTPLTTSEYKPSSSSFYSSSLPPPPSPGYATITSLEQSTITAEANRTQALLTHISDLRNLLKQQIESNNLTNQKKAQLQNSLTQHEMYTDFISSVSSASTSSEMYKVVGEKVKGIFRSQFAELYTVDERTHELVTDLGSGMSSAPNIVFHAAHSSYPYNLTSSDPNLSTHNKSSTSEGSPFLNNALISRLTDSKSRVIGVIFISNHDEKKEYIEEDEQTLTQMVKCLSGVCGSIEKYKKLERTVSSVSSSNLKLTHSSSRNWLTSSSLKTSLKKVTQITESLETKVWIVDVDDPNVIELFDDTKLKNKKKNEGFTTTPKAVKVKKGVGLIGKAFSSSEVILSNNPGSSSQFNEVTDSLTSDLPSGILMCPIFGADGSLIGVLHCVTAGIEGYNNDDVKFVSEVCSELSYIVEGLRNQNVEREDFESENSIGVDWGIERMCEEVEREVGGVVKADYARFYAVDREEGTLKSSSYASPQTTPTSTGILGSCFSTQQTFNITNICHDANYDSSIDSQGDKLSQSALLIPVPSSDSPNGGSNGDSKDTTTIVGVIQILRTRKRSRENPFKTSDLQSVQNYVNQIKPGLTSWSKYYHLSKSLKAESSSSSRLRSQMTQLTSSLSTLQKSSIEGLTVQRKEHEIGLNKLVRFVSDALNNKAMNSGDVEGILNDILKTFEASLCAVRLLEVSALTKPSLTKIHSSSEGDDFSTLMDHKNCLDYNEIVDDTTSSSSSRSLMLFKLDSLESRHIIQIWFDGDVENNVVDLISKVVRVLKDIISSLRELRDAKKQIRDNDKFRVEASAKEESLKRNIEANDECAKCYTELCSKLKDETDLQTVLATIQEMTKKLFDSDYSSFFKLQKDLTVLTIHEGKPSELSLEGMNVLNYTLSRSTPSFPSVKLDRDTIEKIGGNVKSDVEFSRSPDSLVLGKVHLDDRTCYGILEVGREGKDKQLTELDVLKMSKWVQHLTSYLTLESSHEKTRLNLLSSRNSRRILFESLRDLSMLKVDFVDFLKEAQAKGRNVYGARRCNVYVRDFNDESGSRLVYLNDDDNLVPLSVTSSIPNAVYVGDATKCFSSRSSLEDLKLMQQQNVKALDYYLAKDEDTVVVCSPISCYSDNSPFERQQSNLGVVELVLTKGYGDDEESDFNLESVEDYANCLSPNIVRFYNENQKVREFSEMYRFEEGIRDAAVKFSTMLSEISDLDSGGQVALEKIVSMALPELFQASKACMHLYDAESKSLTRKFEQESVIQLPDMRCIEGEVFETKLKQIKKIGQVRKLGVPIFSPETDNVMAVLVLEGGEVGKQTKQELLDQMASLLGSYLQHLHQLSTERFASTQTLSTVTSRADALTSQIARMQYLNQISTSISQTNATSLNLHNMFETVVSHSCTYFNADRATLFLNDASKSELYSLAGGTEIRVPLTAGIVGHVAQANTTLNIKDAYRDVRFNREVDIKTGYVTKSILAGALTNDVGDVVGVLQVINKKGDGGDAGFTSEDEGLMQELFGSVGKFICERVELLNKIERDEAAKREAVRLKEMENAMNQQEFSLSLQAKEKELNRLSSHVSTQKALLDLSACFANDLNTLSVFDEAVVIAPRVLSCDRATLFLIDEKRNELYSFTKSNLHESSTMHLPSGRESPVKDHSEIRIPLTSGIAGFVASTSQLLNIPDAYDDHRFNKEVDLRTGYRTKAVICGPVCDASGKMVGVLQCINKQDEEAFTRDDEVLHLEMTRIIGGAVEKCFLHDESLHTFDQKMQEERMRTKQAEEERKHYQRETKLMQVTDKFSSDSVLSNLFKNIVKHAPNALGAERATLFLYNRSSNELSSRNTSNEGEEFHFSASTGLAGFSATTGTTVNVKDAYEDSRFNRKFDTASGFRTRAVLAAPIFDPDEQRVAGVLQVINCTDKNKVSTGFNSEDEGLLMKLNGQLGVAISRCLKYELEHAQEEKLIEEEKQMIENLEKINKAEENEIHSLKDEVERLTGLSKGLEESLGARTDELAKVTEKLEKVEGRAAKQEEDFGVKEKNFKEEIMKLKAEVEQQSGLGEQLKREKKSLEGLLQTDQLLDKVGSALANNTKMKSLFEEVCMHACDLMRADRATLFLADKDKAELWSMVAHGEQEIRIPLTAGIAGHCACTGIPVNIKDAYTDVRFNRSVDLKTGYVTKTILASPVFDHTQQVTGVLQVINKKTEEGGFTASDEETMGKLNSKISDAINKCMKMEQMQADYDRKLKQEQEKEKELEEKLKLERAQQEALELKLKAKGKELEEEMRREAELKMDLLEERNLQKVSEALANDLEVMTLFDQVCEHACELMRADRATLFLIDREKGEIYSQIAHGSTEIRVPLGVGIAGYVATSGEMVNIPDAYKDARFNADVDKKSGYRTRTILCAPLFESSGAIVGVLQIINKEEGVFERRDEDLMRKLGVTTAAAIRRCQEYSSLTMKFNSENANKDRLQKQLQRTEALQRMSKTIASDLKMQSLFDEACAAACDFMLADRASLFLIDHEKDEIWSQVAQGTGEIRCPMGVGIAGYVASTGEMVNITDAYKDKRFNPEVDRKSGYRTETILCGSVLEASGEIIGVLQLINKEGGVFTEEDEDTMAQLCDTLAAAIYRCQEHSGLQRLLTEEQQKEMQLQQELERERLLQRMSQTIANDLQMQNLFDQVCESACKLMTADRATLFLIDHEGGEIWSQVAKGSTEIRVPLGVGIAGFVATTGRSVNIEDAYKDARFNPEVDKKSGYRTKTILCCAVLGDAGEIVGVLQIINKEIGVFGEEDERLLKSLNETVASGIRRCQEYSGMKTEYEEALRSQEIKSEEYISSTKKEYSMREEEYSQKLAQGEKRAVELQEQLRIEMEKERLLIEKEKKLEGMLELQKIETEVETIESLKELADLSGELARKSTKKGKEELNDLFIQITDHACTFMKADRATVFFYDKVKNMLWSKVAKGTKDIRFSADTGIAGEVCKSKRVLNIKDPKTDPRFNASIDKKTSYVTVSILAVPIFGEGGEGEKVMGVLQILNKKDGKFNERDEQKAILMTKQISAAMQMHVHRQQEKEDKERSPEEKGGVGGGRERSFSMARTPRSISPTPGGGGSSRKRAVTMGGLGSPIQRSSLAPTFESLLSEGGMSPNGKRGGGGGGGFGASLAGTDFSSPSPLHIGSSPLHGSPRSRGGTPGGAHGHGHGHGHSHGHGPVDGIDRRQLVGVTNFFTSVTSDKTLVSEAGLCKLVGEEVPALLGVENVSLWIQDEFKNYLWNRQEGGGGEKLVIDAADGVVGACVKGRVAQKMMSPSWSDVGTLKIPGMRVSESVGFVYCVPVTVGGEIIGMLQVVSVKRTKITGVDEDMGNLIARVVGFSLMMMRVSGVVVEKDETCDRLMKANKSVNGVQFLFGGGLEEICDGLISGHVKGLLGGREATCTLYVAEGNVLTVPGRPDWPAMSLGSESSLVGKCGWLGIAQLYNNILGGVGMVAGEGEEKGEGVGVSVGELSNSPTKAMMSMSGIGGGSGHDESSLFDSGRVSPQQEKLNSEGSVRAVCLPLVLPYSEQNARFGVLNKDRNVCIGVLRVSEKHDGELFSEADVKVMLAYASQVAVAICGIVMRKEMSSKLLEEAIVKHKKDKRVAYSWKKSSEGMMENLIRVGEACAEVIGLVGDGEIKEEEEEEEEGGGGHSGDRRLVGRAGVDQVVTAAGKELIGCDEFGLVLREEANHKVGGVSAPKDLILQALRRGVVVKRGDRGLAVLCMPVWDGTVIHGVLCALRRAKGEGEGVKEFGENDEAIAGVLGNILGVGVKQIGLGEMWRRGGGGGGGGVEKKKGSVLKKGAGVLKGKNKRTKRDVDDADGDFGGFGKLNINDDEETERVLGGLATVGRATTFDHLAQSISSVLKQGVADCNVYLYSVEEKTRSLKALFPGMVKTVSTTSGILGYVASTGRSELVVCARLHRLFDAGVDCHGRSGGGDSQPMYFTPLCDQRKKVIGVLQVVGKDRAEGFEEDDVVYVERMVSGVEDGLSRCALMETLTEESYAHKQGILKAAGEVDELKAKIEQLVESGGAEKGRLLRLITACRNMLLEKDVEGLIKFGETAMRTLMASERASVYLVNEEKGDLWTYGREDVGGMEVRVPKGKGILGHVCNTGKTVNMAGGGDMDLSSGSDVKLDSGFKTTSLLCVPVWSVDRSKDGENVVGGLQRGYNNKVIGAVMIQNKSEGGVFDSVDEIVLNLFGDFFAVGLLNAELQDRALLMTTSVHAQFQGMNEKIEELMAGKFALESAEGMLRVEEEGEEEKKKALRNLIEMEKEMDRQAEVVDALLH